MSHKLTKRALEALQWIADHEPVSMFPLADKKAPSRVLRNRFEKQGLIATAGRESGAWGFTRYKTTLAGREALSAKGAA